MAEEEPMDLTNIEVEELLTVFLGLLSGKALEYMGVAVKEEQEPVKDLRRASVAINSMSCLLDQAQPLLADEAERQYRALISELQLNYVRVS